jgi:deoxyribodipyrimidine photo-lyase
MPLSPESMSATRRTAVLLFTRDLRVHDNPALWAACASADWVVPVFVSDPAVAGQPESGNRQAFLLESLEDLRASLRARGGDLYVRRGDTVAEAMRVVRQAAASCVHVTEDVSALARARHARLAAACSSQRCQLVLHPGHSVVAAGELTPAGRDHYAVFTPYWRRWHAAPWRASVQAPRRVPRPPSLGPAPALGRVLQPSRVLSPGRARGGETQGRLRWARWSRRELSDYGQSHDDLAGDRTSRLSPYLHFGCLSALELARRASDQEAFVRQLCWRDFHTQVLAAFPELPRRDYRRKRRRWRRDPAASEAWREGRTGVPIVDAAMRQLTAEGFIHNRARLLAASFLVRDLGLDWRLGAAHFVDWLVDADVANNSGNWQWVAGTGNDTRPNRTFNVIRQARRFDPRGAYVRRYVPELAGVEGGSVHEPWRLPAHRRHQLDYPGPIADIVRRRARS